MYEIDVANWEEFEKQLQSLKEKVSTRKQTTTANVSDLLFRGQSNHTWLLTTTLERNRPEFRSLYKYYKLIFEAKSQIETFTGMSWDIPTYHEYARWLEGQKFLNTYDGNNVSTGSLFSNDGFLKDYC